jgi:peptidoglycan/xylan/chitin deacetylase (PgdA/CDA1 family)
MILVLTYHRVSALRESEPEFYTTQASQLERWLDLLESNGFHALKPGELIDPGYQPKSGYLLTFDDGTRDHYDVVFPLLERRGIRGIFFVPTAKLGREGYLTADQVRSMWRAGQAIGSHSHEHRRLDRLMEEDIRVQLEVAGTTIAELTGEWPEYFAAPGGFMNRQVHQRALESGARAIRTMKWGYNRNLDLTSIECVPLNRFMKEKEFMGVLRFQGLGMKYVAKQISRRLIPDSAYERARNAYFRTVGRN